MSKKVLKSYLRLRSATCSWSQLLLAAAENHTSFKVIVIVSIISVSAVTSNPTSVGQRII